MQKHPSTTSLFGIIVLIAGSQQLLSAGTINTSSKFPIGYWQTGADWTGGVVPNNGTGGNNYAVTINPSDTISLSSATININSLSLSGGLALGNASLTSGGLTGDGNLRVQDQGSLTAPLNQFAGLVSLEGGNHYADLILTNSVISAAATIQMGQYGSTGNNYILSQSGGPVTNNGVIQGPGFLQGISSLSNYGVIDASSGVLHIQSTFFTNGPVGTLESNGDLRIETSGFTNLENGTLTGGNYLVGNGATITLPGAAVTGIGLGTQVALGGSGMISNGTGDALAQLSVNSGLFQVSNGYSSVLTSGTLTNNGILAVDQSQLSSTGGITNSGNVDVQNNSTLNAASLNNQAAGTVTATTGSVNAGSGGFTNAGTVIAQVGSEVSSVGTLQNSGKISLTGGSGAGASSILNNGSITADTGSTIAVSNTFENQTGGTVAVGSGVSSYSNLLEANQVLNDGGDLMVFADGEVVANSFVETAGTATVSGLLAATTASIQGGALQGDGIVQGSVDNSGGTVLPTGAGLEINGDYTQDAGGTLMENQGSDLTVNGNVTLSGIFDGLASPTTTFSAGDVFEAIHFTGTENGSFTGVDLPTLSAGLQWQEINGANDVSFEVVAGSATPEPSTMFLSGAALLALGLVRRKRKVSASR